MKMLFYNPSLFNAKLGLYMHQGISLEAIICCRWLFTIESSTTLMRSLANSNITKNTNNANSVTTIKTWAMAMWKNMPKNIAHKMKRLYLCNGFRNEPQTNSENEKIIITA